MTKTASRKIVATIVSAVALMGFAAVSPAQAASLTGDATSNTFGRGTTRIIWCC